MPSRAKLTTRGISATTVTTETLPKNLPLTNNELDSNFINLRDQTFSIVGDDSTGIDIKAGDTIKFTGSGGATVTASGDTITVTAGGGGGGSANLGNLQVNDTTLSPIVTNSDLTLIANGTGQVIIEDLIIDELPTDEGAQPAGLYLKAGTNQSNIGFYDNGTLYLEANGPFFAKSGTGQDLNLITTTAVRAISSTKFVIGNVGINPSITSYSGTLTINTAEGTNSGSIILNAGINGNIEIAPNGTGDVYLTADTVRVGDENANATITTNGTGDLILNTNAGTNSGSITIADGTNGTITVATNGTGYLDLHKSFDSTNFPQTPASGNTNWAGATSTSYVGTRMLYSNQAQGDITQADDRVRANTRLISIKHPNDSTTYNDTDYIIQNTDLIVLDINGQSFGSTLTGSRGASVRGEANNVIMKNTAGGTKTGPNLIGGSGFVEVENGHGGDLTAVNVMGFRSFISNRANTGEFTRMTNAYGFLAEGIGAGGSGTSGTNRFVTNEFGFWSQGSTSSNLVTNYYGFYANTGATATNKYAFYSADDAYLSRLGTIERVREKQNALTSSSTITVDADLAPVHKVTLAENTQFGITGLSTGQTVTIIITQDGTGNRTATFTSDTSTAVKFAGGTPALSTAANAIDVVKIYNDGTNFLGVIEKAFA